MSGATRSTKVTLSAGGKYTINFVSADFAITPLAITGNFTAGSKVYDGNTSAAVLTRTLNGVLTADLPNVSLSGGTATFADPYVGPSKTVTLAGATLAGSAAANYTVTSVATTVASITSQALSVSSGLSANNKVYDGDTVATISSNNVVLSGVVVGDAGTVALSTNGYGASFASAGVNNGIVVMVSGLRLTGASATNYTLTQPVVLAASITSQALSVSRG